MNIRPDIASVFAPLSGNSDKALADYQWAKSREFANHPERMKAVILNVPSADWAHDTEDLDDLLGALLNRLDADDLSPMERATLNACDTALAEIKEQREEFEETIDNLPYRKRSC